MIPEIILAVVVLLFIFYLLLEWNSKRQLNKLRRNYNEQNDKSRRGNPAREDFRTAVPADVSGESVVKGIEQSEGRQLLQATVDKPVDTNQRELPTNESKPKKGFRLFRRKPRAESTGEL